MIPIIEKYNKKTNPELKKEIQEAKKINVNYYPIIAKRAIEDNFFKEYLIDELNSKENLDERFFGVIKISWLVLISIIENSDSKLINQAINIFENWPQNEKENLINYVKEEKEIIKYLK